MSLNKLHRETGIWTKPTATHLYDRKCLFSDSLEDEYHFNLKCNFYTELRKQYIPVYFTNNHSMLKLIDLMKSEKEHVVRNVSVFLFIKHSLSEIVFFTVIVTFI